MRIRELASFTWKVVVVHTVTYFVFGLLSSTVFDYSRLFSMEIIRAYMRPVADTGVIGLAVQPLRGVLLAAAFWPLRDLVRGRRHGWTVLWGILALVGVLSPPSAAPGSVEGVVYSRLPLWYHLIGLPEMLLQTLTFSVVLAWWDRRRPAADPRTAGALSPFARALRIVSIACFAYAGYAVGALLFVALSRARVDMHAASGNVRTQLMFVVAFLANVAAVAVLSRVRIRGRLAAWQLFAVFWALDAAVPALYRLLLSGYVPVRLSLFLGLLPALILTVSVRRAFPPPVPGAATPDAGPGAPAGLES